MGLLLNLEMVKLEPAEPTLAGRAAQLVRATSLPPGNLCASELPARPRDPAPLRFQLSWRAMHSVLMHVRRAAPPGSADVFLLSENGSTEEAARHLFDLLRQLDGRGYETIHAELAPPAGIGAAYNDRLTRAAAR